MARDEPLGWTEVHPDQMMIPGLENQHLSSRQFPHRLFHGTSADLKPGDTVRPGRELDGRMTVEKGDNAVVYAGTHQDIAQSFASMAADVHGGRARILELHPHAAMGHTSFWGKGMGVYAGQSFKVKGVEDILPPEGKGGWRQGTLPINWRQYAPAGTGDEINHPPTEYPSKPQPPDKAQLKAEASEAKTSAFLDHLDKSDKGQLALFSKKAASRRSAGG